MALDIGPRTDRAVPARARRRRTVFWNGPMGVFEKPQFAAGTDGRAQTWRLADRGTTVVVGGGDSAAAIAQAGLRDRVSHVSTGGGASLEFVQGLDLPGVAVLRVLRPRPWAEPRNRGRARRSPMT